jgi:hypothetical protein
MKTMKKHIHFLLITLVFATLSGCDIFEVEDRSFQDSNVGFATQSNTLTLEPSQAGSLSLTVQLIGEQQDQDLTFNVTTIDSATTAQAGSDYSLPNSSVTINADSSSAVYTYQVSGQGLSATQPKTLSLRVEGSGDFESAELLGRHDLTLIGTQ